MSNVTSNYTQQQIDLEALFKDVAAVFNEIAPDGAKLPTKKDEKFGSSIIPKTGELPDLPTSSTSGLSLQTLLDAISFEQRKVACKTGVENLEAKQEEVAENNAKELEELAKQIEEMRKKEALSGFLKAFQIIGTIIGAIAAAVTIAVGVMTANPLLIAGGVMAAIAVVDSVLSLATDGKVSMAAGFTELGKCMGMSEEDAAWFGMAMQLAFTVATVAVSFGSASVSSATAIAANATQVADKAIQMLNSAQKIMNIANSCLAINQGIVTIHMAVVDYNIADSQATQKELEAILEQIRAALEMEQALLESKMERANALLEDVNDIVEGCNETQSSIANASPSFA